MSHSVVSKQARFCGDQNKEMMDTEKHHHHGGSTKFNSKAEAGAAEYELERGEDLVQQLSMRRRPTAIVVPTNDDQVRARLRSLQQPITLLGEREMERRDRLREALMARNLEVDGDGDGDGDGELDKDDFQDLEKAALDLEDPEPSQSLFYTEGTNDLLKSRLEVLKYSLLRSWERIASSKRKRQEDPDGEDENAELLKHEPQMSQITLECIEIGDERPLSGCAFSPNGLLLATSAWSGKAKIWGVPGVKSTSVIILKGHTEIVTGVVFNPESSISPSTANLATGSADCTAILWSLLGERLKTLKGHSDRLARVAFHPSGAYLGTASFDKSWRLWDVNTGIGLLVQEGHSRAVYGIAFQQDGALAASCGLDALARVWDLRTGRSILALEGHVKPVLGIDFSPNGYHLATGSEDHTCRIWDLRKKQCLHVIPAHLSSISQVKFEPSKGSFLVSASYDNSTRIWSPKDFRLLKSLEGNGGKVMGLDVMTDGKYIATVSYDRTIKLWSHPKPSTFVVN